MVHTRREVVLDVTEAHQLGVTTPTETPDSRLPVEEEVTPTYECVGVYEGVLATVVAVVLPQLVAALHVGLR